MLHTHTLCMLYFITDGYQNSIFCNIASIPSRDYDKSHRLKQRSLIGQPSLRTAVSQACPSGRIQGWYCHRPVATPVTRALTFFFLKFSLNKLLVKHSNFRWSETSWRLCALLWYLQTLSNTFFTNIFEFWYKFQCFFMVQSAINSALVQIMAWYLAPSKRQAWFISASLGLDELIWIIYGQTISS